MDSKQGCQPPFWALVPGRNLQRSAPMNHRIALAWAGGLGAAGVVLGALGAHPLKAALVAGGNRDAWDTAVTFQLVHAAALLGFAGWLRSSPAPAGRCAAWAPRLWILGTLLFSGSIYGLAMGGPRLLGPATPLGGLALIAGWALAGLAALAP
jgi:uncharacterized membrane protein YgdD (TMEM256/DUF423 family)